MHTSRCVFLDRSKIGDEQLSVVLFSREFGKIRAYRKEWKKQTPADIGSILEVNIETKGNSNRIVSLKVQQGFSSEGYSYDEVCIFMETIRILRDHLGEGLPNSEVFSAYELCLKNCEPQEAIRIFTLFFLKLSILFGIFEIQENQSELLRKMYKATLSYPFETVLKIQGISKELLDEIRLHTSIALHRHLS